MTAADHPLPSIQDAREWQYQAQTIAHAAVRLAQDMALDYGKKLILHPRPAVELRYEPCAGFSRGQEPPVLFWARHTANQALSMEGVISRLLTQSAAAPDPEASARIRPMLAELPPSPDHATGQRAGPGRPDPDSRRRPPTLGAIRAMTIPPQPILHPDPAVLAERRRQAADIADQAVALSQALRARRSLDNMDAAPPA